MLRFLPPGHGNKLCNRERPPTDQPTANGMMKTDWKTADVEEVQSEGRV